MMAQKSRILTILGAAMLALPLCAFAQHGGPGGPGGAFGDRIELMGFAEMHGKVVKGAPFSAVAVSESTQTLPDGNKIVRKAQSNLFRDSAGRVRNEVNIPAVGPLEAAGHPNSFVVIHDPVAGTGYSLDVTKKIATTMPAPPAEAQGQFADKMEARKQQEIADGTLKVETLGTQTIGGVVAQGTRYTKTVPAGQIGNEKALVSVSEQWFSNDLQMVVMSKRSDPRFGDTTYTITNLQRQEPAASLFTVPADYTVQQGRAGHHMPPGAGAPPPPPGM